MTVRGTDSPRDLTRYLLGQLEEEAAAALEARYFEDAELFARIEVAADDLATRYAGGTLSAEERARFQTHLLGSRDDQLRLRVSRALAASARHHAVTAPQGGLWKSFLDLLRSQSAVTRFGAAAASVVLAIGVGGLAWRLTRLQAEVSSLRTVMMEQQATAQSSVAAAAESARVERSQREAAERRLADLTTASFVVLPGTERGSGSVLVVPASAGFVRFDLALERSVSGRCRVTVRTPDRAVVWSQEANIPAGASSVTVTIPSALLRSAQYEAVLESVGQDGKAIEQGVYAVTLRRE